MILTETILRLRAACPIFARRVGGTAKFSLTAEMDSEAITAPCAFVMPMGDVGEGRKNNDASSTWITERIAVIVCVTNRVDRSRGDGVSASDMLKTIRQELYDALVAWRPTLIGKPAMTLSDGISLEEAELYKDLLPESHLDTFSYMESMHLSMSSAKLWHQYEFELRYLMDKTIGRDDGGLPHSVENIFKIYGGWSPNIGFEHIDDYDLIVDTAEEAIV